VISIPHEHSQHHDFSTAKRIASQLNDELILGILR
jgi:hypothetical protein